MRWEHINRYSKDCGRFTDEPKKALKDRNSPERNTANGDGSLLVRGI